MIRIKKFRNNKKGVSSIFIAIYLSLIGILLISTLYVGQVISRSSITEYLKIEQDRRQEYFILTKLITETSESNFTYLEVKNTGAITVRIRALYIDGEFKEDPSLLDGDSYIEPKEALNITLSPPIAIDDGIDAQWTLTSERGIKSSELGMNLWDKINGPIYTPNKFYFGPLMLIFDMFHWRSGNGAWNTGWTIPKGTKDVTWRILLTNVDNRTITITDDSDFSLVSNLGQQNQVLNWYINPELGSLTLEPGMYYFVYYTWSKPFSDPGHQNQAITNLNPGTPCLNFLTFTGFFEELDGTLSPFGQTIPFEAILITD